MFGIHVNYTFYRCICFLHILLICVVFFLSEFKAVFFEKDFAAAVQGYCFIFGIQVYNDG